MDIVTGKLILVTIGTKRVKATDPAYDHFKRAISGHGRTREDMIAVLRGMGWGSEPGGGFKYRRAR